MKQLSGIARLLLACVTAMSWRALPCEGAQPPDVLAVWGTQGSGPGQFSGPFGIGVDASGDVYVVDPPTNRIEKFSNDGTFLAEFGGANQHFDGPIDIAFDLAGNIYVSNFNSRLIQVYDSHFAPIRQWLVPSPWTPTTLAIDQTNGLLYTQVDRMMFAFTLDGTFIRSWNYMSTTPPSPYGFCVGPNSLLYTGATTEDVVRVYSAAGTQVFQWGGSGTPLHFNTADAVAVTQDGGVYVSSASQIQEYTTNGTFVTSWGSNGSGNYQFGEAPYDIGVDGSGNLFVVDTRNYRVMKFGRPTTPVRPYTWGRLQSLYR